MQQMLDWDDLQIFRATGHFGSLNKAADALGIHRSTVLRRIDRLETQLGQRLFDRGPDGVLLTAAGERLIPHAENMADETVNLLREADGDHGRPAGLIRVGATFNLAFGLLPRAIGSFRDAFPEISVDLIATPDGYSPVHPDDIDIAFRTLEAGTKGHDEMIERRLGELPVAIYGSKSYLRKNPAPTEFSDLKNHRLVTCGDNLAQTATMKWLAANAAGIDPVYRVSSMLLLLAAVRQDIGLACLPYYLGEPEPGLVRVLDLAPELGADLWILRHTHHRDTARMRAFSEFMSKHIPELL
jgi:DNA-binding transcriptional LysR family regulator